MDVSTPKGPWFWAGFATGFFLAVSVCFVVYQAFFTDDPRVERKEEELADCQDEVKELQDSITTLSTVGYLVGTFQVPHNLLSYTSNNFVPLWGRELTCLVDRVRDSTVYLDFYIDTCFIARRTSSFRESDCGPVRSEMRMIINRPAPIRLNTQEFILKCTGYDSANVTIELYKPTG